MSAKDVIEKLLEGEDLPKVEHRPTELPKLEVSPETLKRAQSPASSSTSETPDNPQPVASGGIERREFTRIEVGDRKLELKFTHGLQFARQYIENISLGGLFLKTQTKAEMGSLMDIEFS